ncbi:MULTISPECIES: glycosyltransferase 87 family protein [Paenarthrobacter]|uniref:Glycosyltransferase 87 family protein n=1 Tax=Paenarthrobacter ureafaciens TaxID=37931 RepID=A0AAX3EF85_PAEUR|nr:MULTISPECIES: glycosyltransferase 87 family protein [Paenarthrobacter]NKR10165.1 mannosyltransferase [Arthrobacter sp. M5]NKR14532.1 mannosyltransferase [Arthrobacter sp. M6]OEH60313.1 mannosyltransferase [Arthrobacter sp. D4]OEH60928.1 mannosyltransferase [Arthrobacter sp. D2]MDO5865770.1 glycosyltransferase 87 family protein [Paenarthrobacter sp. SD-2]
MSATTKPVVSSTRRGWILTSAAAFTLAVAIWFLYTDYEPFLNDFEVYYYGGGKVLEGGDLYAVRDGLPFTYPPFAALLFTGLAALGFFGGSLVFILAALLGAATVAAWLARHYFFGLTSWRVAFADYRFRTTALLGTGAILLLGPWRDTFVFGQINIVLMGVILTDFALHGKARAGLIRWPAGLLIGMAAGVKLTPLAFGLYFLVRRDFKALAWMAAGFFGSIAFAWAILPQASVAFWTKILPDTGRIGGPGYVDNLSLKGLLLHFGMPDSSMTSLVWLALSLALTVLAALIIKWAVAVEENFIAVSTTAILMLLISPVSWSHHWVWVAVALPSMAFAMHRVPSRSGRMRIAGWVIVVFSTIAFYMTPKNLAVWAGAAEWGKDPQTQWQLMVSSLGVACGIAMLVYWAFAYHPARAGLRNAAAPAVGKQ